MNRLIHRTISTSRCCHRSILNSSLLPTPTPTSSSKSVTTSDLLNNLGFIKQHHAGITNYLPLGLTILRNIQELLRKHLNSYGAIEVELSSLSHKELWELSNRFKNDEIYKIKNDDFLLQPTAEEEITRLISQFGKSYKNMPIIVYQITKKWRKEKRARGGLLRGREFYMKDAYSFDIDSKSALKSFNDLNSCYFEFFSELGVPFKKVIADSGDIGGDLSYEWHFESLNGEDVLVCCDSCMQINNLETVKGGIGKKLADECQVEYKLSIDGDLICFYYPIGRKLDLKLIEFEDIVEIDWDLENEQDIISTYNKGGEFKNIIRILDPLIKPGTKMPDLPVSYSRSRMTTFQDIILTQVMDGDQCLNCNEGTLNLIKGIEVGHTFHLGDKYSSILNYGFIDSNGDKKFYEMGCYGIGVSRLIGAIAEVTRDDIGLRWPVSISPWHLTIINLNQSNEITTFLNKLSNSNVKFEIDQRDLSLGNKLNHSKKLGIPLQCIIGKTYPKIEIEIRGILKNDEYKSLLNEKSKEWEWEIVEKNGIIKHLVNIEYADKVIKTLLKDL
ncbi:hypothetical protein CANARDRAFT_30662 [[Candida] arabinofermentans NRRL YB-2248]|uniref:proline--tRNA ligase n=1 Tax=[Candida] arabinofermentans NRRL YB-2248 TaxID=983967 RepID=A0A1E4ST61_9ASCO|nr:hypothetical protein CANARDRAFT_30662 [[Candida] arabinofermentans NRRL YB-2248]